MTYPAEPTPAILLLAGPITANRISRVCRVNGQPVHLSHRCFDLLVLLMLEAGRTVSHDKLSLCLFAGESRSRCLLSVHLCLLRRALVPAGKAIRTVRGKGVRLDTQDDPNSPTYRTLEQLAACLEREVQP